MMNDTGMADVVQRLMPGGRIDPANLAELIAGTTQHENSDLATVLEWRDRHSVSSDVPIVTVNKC
jgi:hypothetical protein